MIKILSLYILIEKKEAESRVFNSNFLNNNIDKF